MHRTAAYSQEEIVRLVKAFAYAKTMATTAEMKEFRDLWSHPHVVTRVEVGHGKADVTQMRRWIEAEVELQRQRLKQAAAAGPGPFGQSLQSMRVAARKFFATYASMYGETARTNEEAANLLGMSARAAAVSLASANIALAWMGLVSGPAVFGLDMARRSFIIATGPASWSFLGKKIAVGVVATFGTKLITDWNEAMNVEFAMTQATSNAPGLVDDGWRLFFQSLNSTTVQKLWGVSREAAQDALNKGQVLNQPGMTVLGNPATENAAAQLAGARQTAQAAEQQLNNYKPQGGGGMTAGKALMKFAAWGLTIQSTCESLDTLRKQWNYNERPRVR